MSEEFNKDKKYVPYKLTEEDELAHYLGVPFIPKDTHKDYAKQVTGIENKDMQLAAAPYLFLGAKTLRGAVSMAAEKGNTVDLQRMVDAGLDLPSHRDDIFYAAARAGHADVAAFLFVRGLKPEPDVLEGLLYLSLTRGHNELSDLLLRRGARLHEQIHGALSTAVEEGHLHSVRVLLKMGANPYMRGDALLASAEQRAHTEIAGILREWFYTPLPAEERAEAKERFQQKFDTTTLTLQDLRAAGEDGFLLLARTLGFTETLAPAIARTGERLLTEDLITPQTALTCKSPAYVLCANKQGATLFSPMLWQGNLDEMARLYEALPAVYKKDLPDLARLVHNAVIHNIHANIPKGKFSLKKGRAP